MDSGSALLFECIQVPLLEESLYRVVLCAGFAKAIGETATILLSGIAFAALHFIYGSPSPDNVLAGFVLAWAYLKSGAISVPILMHAGGNALVILVQIMAAAFAK